MPDKEEVSAHIHVRRTINGAEYDLAEVVAIIKKDKPYEAAKVFEGITGLKAYSVSEGNKECVEAEKVYNELEKTYKPRGSSAFRAQLNASIKGWQEDARNKEKALKQQNQAEKPKTPKITWFAVGVAMSRMKEAENAKRKRDRDIQKALDKINGKKW